jgi:WD40 repeat protein
LSKPGAPPRVVGSVNAPVAIFAYERGLMLVTRKDREHTFIYDLAGQGEAEGIDLRGALMGMSRDGRMLLTMNVDWWLNLDLTQILTRSFSSTINLWDLMRLAEGSPKPLALRGHEGMVAAGDFSRDNRFLVTGGEDKTVRLWDLSRTPAVYAMPHVLTNLIEEDDLDAGARWAITRGPESTALAWDLSAPDPTARPVVLRGHDALLEHAAVSARGRWVATSDGGGVVRLWDMTAADPSAGAKVVGGTVTALVFSPDERWLTTGDREGVTRLWDLSAPEPSASPRVLAAEQNQSADERSIDSIYFSPDARWLITNRSRLWDLHAPNATPAALKSEKFRRLPGRFAVSPDSRWLAFAAERTVELWDLKDKNPAATGRALKEGEGPLAFSPDGRWLLTAGGGEKQPFTLWDLKAADPAAAPSTLPAEGVANVYKIVFSPDGRWLAASNKGDVVWLWNLREPGSAPVGLGGNVVAVEAIDISADSRWLMATSFGAIRLWDLTAPNPSETSVALPGNQVAAEDVMFSRFGPDSHWLMLNGVQDGRSLALWNLRPRELLERACHLAGRNLTQREWKEFFPGQAYRQTCPELPPGSEGNEDAGLGRFR